MRPINFLDVKIDFESFTDPGQETGQFLAAELVSRPTDDHVPVLTDVEVCVAKAPDVQAFRLVRAGLWARFGFDDLCCVCRTQTRKIRQNPLMFNAEDVVNYWRTVVNTPFGESC